MRLQDFVINKLQQLIRVHLTQIQHDLFKNRSEDSIKSQTIWDIEWHEIQAIIQPSNTFQELLWRESTVVDGLLFEGRSTDLSEILELWVIREDHIEEFCISLHFSHIKIPFRLINSINELFPKIDQLLNLVTDRNDELSDVKRLLLSHSHHWSDWDVVELS